MRWSMEEYFKLHSTYYRKPLEISHWDALERLKSLLKWPMSASLSLESDNKVMAGKTLKHLTKLLDRLRGIGRGYDEVMESRSVMVPANGMVQKLREEWKDDGALLFGLIFLAYLDIGGRDGHGIPKCNPCPSVVFLMLPGPSVRFCIFFGVASTYVCRMDH